MSPNNKQERKKNINVEKQDYENNLYECNELQNLITTIVGRNITIISKQEYHNVRIKKEVALGYTWLMFYILKGL